jgi:hypothetical protein
MGIQYNQADNIATTLNGAINNSVTSIVVTSSTGFPATPFVVICDFELMLVTAVVTTTWTVTRATEGTAAASHLTGAIVRQVVTLAAWNALVQLQTGTTTAQTGAVNINGASKFGTTSLTDNALVVNNQEDILAAIDSTNNGNGNGVYGHGAGSGAGVKGISASGNGVDGLASTSAKGGAHGTNSNNGGYGVWGENTAGSDGAGAGGKFDGGTHTIGLIAVTNHATKTAVDASNAGGGPGIKVDRLQLGTSYWLDKGTSFPGSPTSGDQFYRTDRNIQYYWDGTNWLSTFSQTIELIPVTSFTTGIAATTGFIMRCARLDPDYSVYVTKAEVAFQINTTFDVTNNWTTSLFRHDSTATNTTIATVAHWATGRTAGTTYVDTATINAAYSTTQAFQLRASFTKNAAPGTLDISGINFHFRLVG